MDIEEQARQRLVSDRQHDRHLHENLVERAEEEVQDSSNPSNLEEEARERLAEARHQEEHLAQNMAERTEEELKDL